MQVALFNGRALTLGALLCGAVSVALAGADQQIAFSKRLGVEVYAQDAGTGWCRPEPTLRVVAQDTAIYQSAEFADLLRKVGSQVIAKQCASAERALITGFGPGSTEPRYAAKVTKRDGWAVAGAPPAAPAAAAAPQTPDREPPADLLSAAERGDLAAVERFLAQGAALEARDGTRRTPLYKAARHGHAAVVHALLAKGAAVDARSNDGTTALMAAAAFGHDAVLQTLLAKGADLNAKDRDGETALAYAAMEGRLEAARALLAAGAVLDAPSGSGATPLLLAAEGGHAAVVRDLLARGADIEARDTRGQTALMGAAALGHDTLVQLLLSKGANVGAKTSDGETAATLAAKNGHEPVVQLLRAAAASGGAKAKGATLSYAQWEECRDRAAASADPLNGRQGIENAIQRQCGEPPVREAGTEKGIGVRPSDLVRSKTWKTKFMDVTGDQYAAFLRRLDVTGVTELQDGWIVGEGNAAHGGSIDEAALAIDTRTGKVYAAMLVDRSRLYGFGFGESWANAPPSLQRWARQRGLK